MAKDSTFPHPDMDQTGFAEIDELKRARDEIRQRLEALEIGSKEREGGLQALDRLTRALKEQSDQIDRLHIKLDHRKRLQKKHLQLNAQLQRFLGEQFQNSLAQHLVATRLSVASLLKKQKSGFPVTAEDLEQLSDYMRVAENEAKSLAQGIIPIEAEGVRGLVVALELLVKRVCELWEKVNCQLEVHEKARIEDNFVALKLYYIAREAVNNALRHAQATTILIRLRTGRSGETILEVEDDGIGVDEGRLEQNRGLGLEIMQLRSEIIDSRLEIKRRKEGGTMIRCVLQPSGS